MYNEMSYFYLLKSTQHDISYILVTYFYAPYLPIFTFYSFCEIHVHNNNNNNKTLLNAYCRTHKYKLEWFKIVPKVCNGKIGPIV